MKQTTVNIQWETMPIFVCRDLVNKEVFSVAIRDDGTANIEITYEGWEENGEDLIVCTLLDGDILRSLQEFLNTYFKGRE